MGLEQRWRPPGLTFRLARPSLSSIPSSLEPLPFSSSPVAVSAPGLLQTQVRGRGGREGELYKISIVCITLAECPQTMLPDLHCTVNTRQETQDAVHCTAHCKLHCTLYTVLHTVQCTDTKHCTLYCKVWELSAAPLPARRFLPYLQKQSRVRCDLVRCRVVQCRDKGEG